MYAIRSERKRNTHTVAIVQVLDKDFMPTDWQHKPRKYRILDTQTYRFAGRADATVWLHNDARLQSQDFREWAILLG